ncbi:MAG: beta-phosphoglucomutase [Lachnospiraceae bacterium]|nr:beta-phosphoglucomutase [Lachnospiraceae bacterium]
MKGFIFDLDGVLVFTDKYHYQAWKKMADELGVYFDEKINNRLRGVSRMDSLEIILENYHGRPLSAEEKVALATKKNDTYRKLLSTMTSADVTTEVRQTLRKLHDKGYKIALGSSSKNAKYILEKVELLDAFDAISDGTNITYSKPNPEVFLKAAEYIDLDPRDCAVVEDATSGIDAAKAGSMVAVAIGDATGYDKADYRIERLDELLELC